ncbi:hypothetical protein ACO0QE_003790 [Hanseniaspora vineae]
MPNDQAHCNEMPIVGIPVGNYIPAGTASPLAPQHQYYYAQPANMGNYCYYPQPVADYEVIYDGSYGAPPLPPPPMHLPEGTTFSNTRAYNANIIENNSHYMVPYGEPRRVENSNIHFATYNYNMKVRENMNNQYNSTNDRSFKNKNFKNRNNGVRNNTNRNYYRYNGNNQQNADFPKKSKIENGNVKRRDYSSNSVNSVPLDATLEDFKFAVLENYKKSETSANSLNKTIRITTKEASLPYFNKTSNYELYEFQKIKAQKFMKTVYHLRSAVDSYTDKKRDAELSNLLTKIGIEDKNASLQSYKDIRAKMTSLEQKVVFSEKSKAPYNIIESKQISTSEVSGSTKTYKKDKTLLREFSKQLLRGSSVEERVDEMPAYESEKNHKSQNLRENEKQSAKFLRRPLSLQKQNTPILQPLSPSKSSIESTPSSPTRNLASSNKYYKTTDAHTASSIIEAEGAMKHPPKLEQIGETEVIPEIIDADEDANITEKDLSIDSIDTSGIKSYKEQPVSNLNANDGFSFVDLSFDGKAMDRSDVFRMCDSFSVDESSFLTSQRSMNISTMANLHGITASRRGFNTNDQLLKNLLSQELPSSSR